MDKFYLFKGFGFAAPPLLIVIFLAVIFPNSHNGFLFAILFFSACLSCFYIKGGFTSNIYLWLASSIVTMIYIIYGIIMGASLEGVGQAAIIYIAAPLLWYLNIAFIFERYAATKLFDLFYFVSMASCAGLFLFIYLFVNFGSAPDFLYGLQEMNAIVSDDYVGATSHVSGSLIFIASGYFAQPSIVKSWVLRTLLLLTLFLTAAASGRSALMLAIFIGLLLGFFANFKIKDSFFKLIFIPTLFGMSTYLIFHMIFGINILDIFFAHYFKLAGGDTARPEQMVALFNGSVETLFMGAGHGIGVDYIRSDEYPWRYESVWIALIYKVGLLGGIIVLLPLIASLIKFYKAFFSRKMVGYDMFFGSSLTAAFLAGFTNPYPEAIAFQWMYVIPCYYFLGKIRNKYTMERSSLY